MQVPSLRNPFIEDLQNDDLEILLAYNAEFRGIYNYYKLDSFKHIMEYSMYKTFANKYKTSVRKINAEFRINGHFGVRYDTKKGSKVAFFYSAGFKKGQSEESDSKVDLLADYKRNYIYNRTKLDDRLLSSKCEWCEMEGVSLQMHHVRKLKDLKGKKRWEKRMIERKRKTLALCRSSHLDLHNGKLD
ncbi:HNH endonuclease [Paenibacillus sp. MAEPY2]|uniref:HNH endonuclease n=1 Tax=Paenibacillus sp. MAEPY2 TaxID=1395587 RepID=UPI0009DEC0BD|nr:group II intron reverse transcriptase/maturase [Paenibacillus sp. MAEPY2]